MNIGNQILNIRKENQLTQEEFGKLFHVTRQTLYLVYSLHIDKNYSHYCWNYNDRYWLV